jgi:hypothetical protein
MIYPTTRMLFCFTLINSCKRKTLWKVSRIMRMWVNLLPYPFRICLFWLRGFRENTFIALLPPSAGEGESPLWRPKRQALETIDHSLKGRSQDDPLEGAATSEGELSPWCGNNDGYAVWMRCRHYSQLIEINLLEINVHYTHTFMLCIPINRWA